MAKIREAKLKSGKTVYRSTIYLGINPATGKPKYTQITEETYSKAKEVVDQLTVDRNNVKTIKKSDITFQMAYNEWFSTYKNTVKLTTVESVESKMKAVLPFLAHYKLKKINHDRCQRMINDLVATGLYKRSTIQNFKLYASIIFRYCLKQEYIVKNPMEYVEIPKVSNDFLYTDADKTTERKYWLKDEVINFLKLAKSELKYFDYVMFRVLLFSGLRKGELQALHWSDINFMNGEVIIAKTLSEINGEYILQKPKTASSKRIIILDGETLSALEEWKQQLKEEYFAFGNRKLWENDPAVFSEPDGKYFPLSHLNNVMNYNFYLHHPEFHRITIHQMRHTHASLLFESGASLKDVQAKLGHSDMQTTMNIYTHVTETKSKKTTNDFAKFMEI